jgi:hypothetical protein
MEKFSKEELYELRNQVEIRGLLTQIFEIESKILEQGLRYRCPSCKTFEVGINPNVNLCRCFKCNRNFNPIDFAMVHKEISFVESVKLLKRCLPLSKNQALQTILHSVCENLGS